MTRQNGATDSAESRRWIARVFFWDGIVPTAVSTVVHLLYLCCPKNSEVPVLGAVAAIIAAFGVRLAIGGRYFDEHAHFGWQVTLFFVALLYLLFCETFYVAACLEGASYLECAIPFLVLLTPYFAAMSLVYYPFAKLSVQASED